jgi:hypothetical protein
MSNTRPTTGRIVRYRGKHGLHAVRAAIVTADIDTLDPEGVRVGAVPALESDQHVHLLVFTPGVQGSSTSSTCRPATSRARGTGRSACDGQEA